MSVLPTNLELTAPDCLQITWSDGQVRRYMARQLRDSCPCATCREKRKADDPAPLSLPVLSAAEAQPLRIEGMKPVGNYAYSVVFSDQHDTGIYTLEHLRQLGEVVT